MVNNYSKIAYLGPEGSYSHYAALTFQSQYTQLQLTPHSNFTSIFESLTTNPHTLAAIPIENSITGDVQGTFGELFTQDITIHQELYLPIEHVLLVATPIDLSRIQTVYSHPQGLAQCSQFLEKLNCEKIVVESTSAAAQMVATSDNPYVASISSPVAAELYQLHILKSHIGNYSYNRTRFVLISHSSHAQNNPSDNTNQSGVESFANQLPTIFTHTTSNNNVGEKVIIASKANKIDINQTRFDEIPTHFKTTIIFELPNVSGALAQVINQIKNIDGNMTKIESRVIPHQAWEYQYYIDFITDKKVNPQDIINKATAGRVLGIYPSNQQF